jgi:hypothetical protein
VAEGDGLLNRYTESNPYPGFESPSLRFFIPVISPSDCGLVAQRFIITPDLAKLALHDLVVLNAGGANGGSIVPKIMSGRLVQRQIDHPFVGSTA